MPEDEMNKVFFENLKKQMERKERDLLYLLVSLPLPF
jgi:hypothetical protein